MTNSNNTSTGKLNNIDLGKSFETFKQNNMKATIKRVIEVGKDPQFQVWAGDKLVKCLHYKPEAGKDDIWNEERNLNDAKALVKIIEKSEINGGRIEETIYETPDDLPADLFTSPGVTN